MGAVTYKSSVGKDLRRLPRDVADRITSKAEKILAADPDVGDALSGNLRGCFAFRAGNYRVIYKKTADGVDIQKIAHRKHIYR